MLLDRKFLMLSYNLYRSLYVFFNAHDVHRNLLQLAFRDRCQLMAAQTDRASSCQLLSVFH